MNSCNNLAYIEQKKTNGYMWLGKAAKGPSANFKVEDSEYSIDLQASNFQNF